jgi:hypothetical protein
MSIKAKIEGSLRIIGMVLLLVSLVLDLFLPLFLRQNFLINIIKICYILPWVIISFGFKAEKFFFYEKRQILLVSAGLISILCGVSSIFLSEVEKSLFYLINLIAVFLLIVTWHFSLTIEKRLKIIFLFTGIGYIFLKFINIAFQEACLSSVLLIILVLIAIAIIIMAEWSMIRKDLLNYI